MKTKRRLKAILIMFLSLTSISLIGQSDSTNINLPIETKIEIVKTLTAYPLVVDGLHLTEDLLESSKTINFLQAQQLEVKDNQILNLQERLDNSTKIISNLEDQKKAFKRKLTMDRIKIGGVGLAAVIVGVLIASD